ncbi:hypothetical protein Tco_0811381 [Tanacetum coccineum]
MVLHADKDWETFIKSGEHHNRDAKVVGLSKCLFGWDVKKGKRGHLRLSVDVVKVNKVPNAKYYFGLGTYDPGEVDEDMQEAAKILVLMAHDHQLKAKTSIMTQSEVQAVNGLMCLDDPVTPPTVESGAQVEELMATSMTERNLHVKESTDTISGEIKGGDFDLNKLPTFEDESRRLLPLAGSRGSALCGVKGQRPEPKNIFGAPNKREWGKGEKDIRRTRGGREGGMGERENELTLTVLYCADNSAQHISVLSTFKQKLANTLKNPYCSGGTPEGTERTSELVYLRGNERNSDWWTQRFLVFLDGLEPYLLKTLEDGPFVPMSSLSTSENPLPKRQNQWSNAESRLANQDKRLKTLRLKFNAFKSLEGEKVNGTFTRLKCLLNDLENNGVTIPQAEVNAIFVNSLPRK